MIHLLLKFFKYFDSTFAADNGIFHINFSLSLSLFDSF